MADPIFDLEQAATEVTKRKPWKFKFDGVTYVLPASMDIRAVAAISAGRLDDGLRILLGEGQWQSLQDSPKLLTSEKLTEMFEAYAAYTNGATVGESSASTGSSVSTGRPSRQTSNGTTTRSSVK